MATGRSTWGSFGNTRRPKTLSTPATVVGGTLETARTVAVATSGTLAPALDSATEGRNGYATENQRFLHVQVEGSNSKVVQIFGYNYAFGVWAPLYAPESAGDAALSYRSFKATTASNGSAVMYIFDIAGVDRVAFVTADTPGSVKAACSSF